jgi:hypothetical protein
VTGAPLLLLLLLPSRQTPRQLHLCRKRCQCRRRRSARDRPSERPSKIPGLVPTGSWPGPGFWSRIWTQIRARDPGPDPGLGSGSTDAEALYNPSRERRAGCAAWRIGLGSDSEQARRRRSSGKWRGVCGPAARAGRRRIGVRQGRRRPGGGQAASAACRASGDRPDTCPPSLAVTTRFTVDFR